MSKRTALRQAQIEQLLRVNDRLRAGGTSESEALRLVLDIAFDKLETQLKLEQGTIRSLRIRVEQLEADLSAALRGGPDAAA